MARVLTVDGKFKAGAYRMSGRKRPVLCIEQEGEVKEYGVFHSTALADEFMDRLGELVGAYIEPKEDK